MRRKEPRKKFTKIIQDDFNKAFVRFTYYNNTYPTFFAKKAEFNLIKINILIYNGLIY